MIRSLPAPSWASSRGPDSGRPLRKVPVLAPDAASIPASNGLSEERFRALVGGLPGFVYTCPEDFKQCVYASPQVFELTGYTPEEYVTKTDLWIDHVHCDDKERVLETFSTAMLGGVPVSCEYRWLRRDGQVRWFRDHATKIRGNADQGASYQGVVLDITEAKDGELLRAESLAKSRFFAGMSHELRNPLNSVLGFAELLESKELGTLSDKQSRYVRNIRQSGQLLLELVNDVLDFSKLQARQMTADVQPVPLDEAIAGAIERMAPIAATKGVRLATSGPSSLVALADRRRLTQVLINLLSNAIKFTPAGGNVTVEAWKSAGKVRIAIRDTGIGIPAKQQAAIFDEFHQVDNEETRSQIGTGLGLALSRGLMTLMEGTIAVASAAGEGSTFTLTLRTAVA